MVSTDDVKRLREETGAGVMDAKRALDEAGGSFDRAREILREKGIAQAAKRADRATGQGMVEAYIHNQGRIGAMVELQCETDFVARTDGFRQLARDIAMQVAAMSPVAVNAEDLPEGSGPAEEAALMDQAFIRDASKTIASLLQDQIAQTGENIRIARFSRFELGGE